MRRVWVLVPLLVTLWTPLEAADSLGEARRLYNLGQYDAAERAARDASLTPDTADAARIVIGRIRLERFRQSASPTDLTAAREALRDVDPRQLDGRERIELAIGLAEALYLEDRFGAAAELFESVLDRSAVLGPMAHERVLDWWATSLDRHAQTRPVEARGAIYERMLGRMRAEIAEDPGSTAAGYWLAASERGMGDPDRAWNAALAGWVRATLAHDRGAALRADLERLVVQAIIPERASRLQLRDPKDAEAGMLSEWESFKSGWSR